MSQNDGAEAGSSGVERLGPCYPCNVTPGGTRRVEGDNILHEATGSESIQPRMAMSTPLVSPVSSPGQRKRRRADDAGGSGRKKSRRSLGLKDADIFTVLEDSGSECDDACKSRDDYGDETGDEEDLPDHLDFNYLRQRARNLRKCMVAEDPKDRRAATNVDVNEEKCESRGGSRTQCSSGTSPGSTNFVWSEDFTSFYGYKEKYSRVPGPSFASQIPVDIFEKIWDANFIGTVVQETNEYAWQVISAFSDPDIDIRIPNYLDYWFDVTVEELYRYFAMLIYMSHRYCSSIREYWETGTLGMPLFRDLMSRNRFLLISKFLHFTNNQSVVMKGNQRKIEKIIPVIDHCNERFRELYTPGQFLSLDESLLLWKGSLSWKQCNRSKAARFGIKSFELCEADTGYLLQYRLYTGKENDIHRETIHGFQDHTGKVVLDLMQNYLDVGHVLVMDNWYNQLPLTRYLKTRCTDVLGTISRRRNGIPSAIKDLIPKNINRGAVVSRHCGDMALTAWMDVKLVTVISSYHHPEMMLSRRAGQAILKPNVVHEYNRYMGGVDLKDQKLSMFLMERKRNQKWYIKVFRRLLNTSLLNAFIIYQRNPMYRVYSHRHFRMMVAEGLLSRYPRVSASLPRRVPDTKQIRLQPGKHYPIRTECISGSGKGPHRQLRCVRCSALGRRVTTTYLCKMCQVPLCTGQCWEDYHELPDLKKIIKKADACKREG